MILGREQGAPQFSLFTIFMNSFRGTSGYVQSSSLINEALTTNAFAGKCAQGPKALLKIASAKCAVPL